MPVDPSVALCVSTCVQSTLGSCPWIHSTWTRLAMSLRTVCRKSGIFCGSGRFRYHPWRVGRVVTSPPWYSRLTRCLRRRPSLGCPAGFPASGTTAWLPRASTAVAGSHRRVPARSLLVWLYCFSSPPAHFAVLGHGVLCVSCDTRTNPLTSAGYTPAEFHGPFKT